MGGFAIGTGLALARIVLGFYGFWLVWRVLLPRLPGPNDPDARIAPFARYFTDPWLTPIVRATRLPRRLVAAIALVVVAAGLAGLPG